MCLLPVLLIFQNYIFLLIFAARIVKKSKNKIARPFPLKFAKILPQPFADKFLKKKLQMFAEKFPKEYVRANHKKFVI